MKRFKEGMKLSARSACDHNCVFEGRVLKRSPKTVVVETDLHGVKRCKIHENEDGEFIFPFGKYSMCPVFRA